MIRSLLARLQQKHRTIGFPKTAPILPPEYLGRPSLYPQRCAADCRQCLETCPVGAVEKTDGKLTLDLGRCLFCGQCAEICPSGAIEFSRDYRLAARQKADLLLSGEEFRLAESLGEQLRKLLGRSLKLRQVSAGGCNACEADTNVLTTIVFDLGRFGIQFVASPRHADGLLITGPVPENMRLALEKTYQAVPAPKIVIAVGSCAIAGGPFAGHPEVHNGADRIVPVDLYIPGCPPHPITILDGLLRLLGQIC